MATLNLGFEHLNTGSFDTVSDEALIDMALDCQVLSDQLNTYCDALEETFRAITNAQHVKKVLNKYGRTKSLVAMVGSENLNVIASMEDADETPEEDLPESTINNSNAGKQTKRGAWQKIKDFCIKIINKIKEWWQKFIGLFANKTAKLIKKLNELDKKHETFNPAKKIEGLEKSALDLITKFVDKLSKDAANNIDSIELKEMTFSSSSDLVSYGGILVTTANHLKHKNNEVMAMVNHLLSGAKRANDEDAIKGMKEEIAFFKKAITTASHLIGTAVSALYSAI